MGFGTSATHVIFFVASVIIALAIVGVVTVSVSSIANSVNDKSDHLSEQVKTEISIIGDPCFMGGASQVYVENSGSSFLDANATAFFVDGAFREVDGIDIFANGVWTAYQDLGVWKPGQVARFNMSSALPTGYRTLRAVSEYAVYDYVYYSDC